MLKIPPLCHLALAIVATVAFAVAAERVTKLEIAPSPVDNPRKGLVPYANPPQGSFPCSMEYQDLGLATIVKDHGQYDWQPLENVLNDIASRGRQAVIRFYLESPGRTDGIPRHLEKSGLTVHRHQHENDGPFPDQQLATPDYEDPRLREALANFISEFGKKYDNDARIGFIQAGLLGIWGEWHNFPHEHWFASRSVQENVLDAYTNAFSKTQVLLRYPRNGADDRSAANAQRPFGYHDDSFAWATLETGDPNHQWYFMAAMRTAGPEAMDKWKHHAIGGEIRPEAWGEIFDESPPAPIQDFSECVRVTHASWLLDSGMFNREAEPARAERAIPMVRNMGYDFHVR